MTNQIQAMKVAVFIAITMSIFSNAQCQLILKNDAFSNSYSFATPSFQQSFTRYFGGANNANLQQIQPTQQSFNNLQRFEMPSSSNQQQLTAQELSHILQQQGMENIYRQQNLRSTYVSIITYFQILNSSNIMQRN